jgi:hypothetical protein
MLVREWLTDTEDCDVSFCNFGSASLELKMDLVVGG